MWEGSEAKEHGTSDKLDAAGTPGGRVPGARSASRGFCFSTFILNRTKIQSARGRRCEPSVAPASKALLAARRSAECRGAQPQSGGRGYDG